MDFKCNATQEDRTKSTSTFWMERDLEVYKFLLVMGASSISEAACERAFSFCKLLIGDLRQSMSIETLRD